MGNWFSTALAAVEEIPNAAPAGDVAEKGAGGGMGGILVLLLPVIGLIIYILMGRGK